MEAVRALPCSAFERIKVRQFDVCTPRMQLLLRTSAEPIVHSSRELPGLLDELFSEDLRARELESRDLNPKPKPETVF